MGKALLLVWAILATVIAVVAIMNGGIDNVVLFGLKLL